MLSKDRYIGLPLEHLKQLWEKERSPQKSAERDIDRINSNEWTRSILVLIFSGGMLLVLGWLLDMNDRVNGIFWKVLAFFHINDEMHFVILILTNVLDNIYNLIISYNAILAAAVILFYSVMDNRKEGIPHRRIMSFAFGSKSVPALFLISLILVPVGFIMNKYSLYYISTLALIIVFIYQMVIICAVLQVLLKWKSYSLIMYLNIMMKLRKRKCMNRLILQDISILLCLAMN